MVTFPHGLMTQLGQLLALHCSVSAGRLILSQDAAVRFFSAPLASSCWQETCLCFHPLPHEVEHLDQSDTSHLKSTLTKFQISDMTNLTAFKCRKFPLTFLAYYSRDSPGWTVLSVAGNCRGDGFLYVLTLCRWNYLSIWRDTVKPPQPRPSVSTGSAARGPVSKSPAKLCVGTNKVRNMEMVTKLQGKQTSSRQFTNTFHYLLNCKFEYLSF